MRKLNWEIIPSNLAEAREQLKRIELRVRDGVAPAEGEFQVMLEHAYHHLNFAWNVRRISTERYSHLTGEEFDRRGRFPEVLKEFKINGS